MSAEKKTYENVRAAESDMLAIQTKKRKAVCPDHPEHLGAMVYKTVGRVRHCKCNTCGRLPWKQIVEFDEAEEFLDTLAESLLTTPVTKSDGIDCIVIPLVEMRKITAKIDLLLGRSK